MLHCCYGPVLVRGFELVDITWTWPKSHAQMHSHALSELYDRAYRQQLEGLSAKTQAHAFCALYRRAKVKM